MEPDECNRFYKCFAPICPLDKDFLKRTHLDGERSCRYLCEYSKPHARQNLEGVLTAEHYQAIEVAYPKVLARYNHLKKQLEKASKTPTKLNSQPRTGRKS